MKYLLDLLYVIAFTAYLPKALYRRFAENRYKKGGGERLGYVSRKSSKPKCIWIHSVSMGEVNATQTLVDALRKELTDTEIVMSTTTDTGYERAQALYGKDMSIFYYPFDFSHIVERAFNRINPDLCVLVELEVWPNFVQEANKRDVPVIVFNGRLSDKSFPRYRKIKRLTKWMFDKVSLFLVQSPEYADKFAALGVDENKIAITGSVKYDTAQITDKIEGSKRLAESLGIGRGQRLFVAGGTGPDEEKIILDVYAELKCKFADLRLAIVPRKPERFNEVAALIEKAGFDLVRYSEVKNTPQSRIPDIRTVILGDTMGDLRKFYSLSDIVFVGRTLCPMGGSDMMESTAMGKFTVFGPHTFNFKQTVDVLLKGNGAVEAANQNELKAIVEKALCDDGYRKMIAANGQRVIAENQGATGKSVEAIIRLLEKKKAKE